MDLIKQWAIKQWAKSFEIIYITLARKADTISP